MSHERGVHKSWVSRICYAIGNLGQAAYYNALSTFFVTYYVAQTLFRDYERSEAKAMIAIIAALVFIIRIVEIFIDPLLGNLVDNTTSRWGRFKPWQVIGGVGSSILLFAIFTGLFGLVNVNKGVFIVVFIVVFVALALRAAGGVETVVNPFVGDGSVEGIGPVLAGAAILCLSFLGFDAVSTMAEEARDPRRDIPRAILLVTVAGGVMFVLLSSVAQLAAPATTFADPDSATLDVMAAVSGSWLGTFFTAAYVAGCIGSALTSQASVTRIMYVMGRDGVLPRPLALLSRRWRTPHPVMRRIDSLTTSPSIFDSPISRSTKVIGTSTTRIPARTVRTVRSVWKT